MSKMPTPPALIDCKRGTKTLKFMIMDAPSDTTLPLYLPALKQNGVTDIVRVCDPTYSTERLSAENIKVHDWPFEDGEPPPSQVVNSWLGLIDERLAHEPLGCIAVHCVAGLGRAPVLVAVALMESGMEAEDVVSHIRAKRRGAINNKQIKYLEQYKVSRVPLMPLFVI